MCKASWVVLHFFSGYHLPEEWYFGAPEMVFTFYLVLDFLSDISP